MKHFGQMLLLLACSLALIQLLKSIKNIAIQDKFYKYKQVLFTKYFIVSIHIPKPNYIYI